MTATATWLLVVGALLVLASLTRARVRTVALPVALALAIGGCAALPLARLAQGAQWIGAVLDVAQGGAGAYYARHPRLDDQARVDAAMLRARQALAALDAALAAGDAAATGDAAAARLAALAAYRELYALLAALGVLSGAADGGAESDAPLPAPLYLPPPAEVARSM